MDLKKQLKTNKLFPVAFLVFALIAAVIAFNLYNDNIVNSWIKSEGQVISLINDGCDNFTPVVVFENHDGEQIAGMPQTASTPATHQIFEQVTFFYNPENPEEIVIATPQKLLALTYFCSFLSLLGFLAALALFAYQSRR